MYTTSIQANSSRSNYLCNLDQGTHKSAVVDYGLEVGTQEIGT